MKNLPPGKKLRYVLPIDQINTYQYELCMYVSDSTTVLILYLRSTAFSLRKVVQVLYNFMKKVCNYLQVEFNLHL